MAEFDFDLSKHDFISANMLRRAYRASDEGIINAESQIKKLKHKIAPIVVSKLNIQRQPREQL